MSQTLSNRTLQLTAYVPLPYPYSRTGARAGSKHVTEKCIIIQRLYRGFKARQWMDTHGVNFDLRMTNSLELATGEVRKIIKPRGWKDRISEAELHQRVMYDVHQRRINFRNTIATELQQAYLHTSSLIRENIRYWESKVDGIILSKRSMICSLWSHQSNMLYMLH